jgi:hypothetical protein
MLTTGRGGSLSSSEGLNNSRNSDALVSTMIVGFEIWTTLTAPAVDLLELQDRADELIPLETFSAIFF